MNNQLFIPEKLKIGYRNREGTYTGKIAYVIYYDKKGVLRKEPSWESWRDKTIEPIECGNEPTEGFVLNKSGGGTGSRYGWDSRRAFIRVWDPRDFEFEISLPNLLFILAHTDCSRGKGLEGKFVYAWAGTDLVLLPVETEEYQNSTGFTQLSDKKVSARDLIPGATYITKRQVELIYLGKFDYYFQKDYRIQKCHEKRFIFVQNNQLTGYTSLTHLAQCINPVPVPDYAERVDQYLKSPKGSPIKRLFLKKVATPEENRGNYFLYATQIEPNVFVQYYWQKNYQSHCFMNVRAQYTFSEEGIAIKHYGEDICAPDSRVSYYGAKANSVGWRTVHDEELWAETENGGEFALSPYSLER